MRERVGVDFPCARDVLVVALNSGLLVVAIPANAQTSPPPQISDQARNAQAQQLQEEDARRRQSQIGEPDVLPRFITPQTLASNGLKVPIRTIAISGVSPDLVGEIDALKEPYLNKPMGIDEITTLTRAIREQYDRHGYGLIQVRVGEQNLATGVLELSVLEGRLENLVICKNGKERHAPKTAFRIPEGSLFKIRRYEQGLDNLDGLFSYRPVRSEYVNDPNDKAREGCARVRMTRGDDSAGSSGDVLVAPGRENGLSDVIISTRQPRPFWVSAGVDDLGSSATGRTRVNAGFAEEDLLGLFEQIAVRGSHTSDFSSGADRARNLSADVSMPFGYWHAGGHYSYYDYRTTIVTANQPFVTYGSQRFFGGDISRVLTRGRKGVLSADLGFEIKDTENFVDGVKLTNSSHRLSVVSFSLSHRGPFLGGSLYTGLAISQGLSAFGALRDQFASRAIPHAQFTNLAFNGDFQRSIYLPGTHAKLVDWVRLDKPDKGPPPFPDFTIRSSLSASWAPQALYGSEQVLIGGPFTVRGFDETNLSGDVGGVVRNEVSWYPHVSYRSWALRRIGRPSLFAGLDAGTIIHSYSEPSQEDTLLGATFGGRISGRNLSAETRVELPVASPANFASRHAIFRFQVSMRL